MSVAEMKVEAINQITQLSNEGELKEILEHLSKFAVKNDLNLSGHYNSIKDQYNDVLKKLAE